MLQVTLRVTPSALVWLSVSERHSECPADSIQFESAAESPAVLYLVRASR